MKLLSIALVVMAASLTMVLASNHTTSNATSAPVLQVGPPLQQARMTPAQAIQAVKNSGTDLFTYAQTVSTQYGSFTPSFHRDRGIGSYWAITLTGLDKDHNGFPLLPSHPGKGLTGRPNHTTITFIVDDATGKIVEDAGR